LNKHNPITSSTTIVFSASSNARNYLREQVGSLGFNAFCFEKEAICFDNVYSIQPDMVIVETDSLEVVWRFIFMLHASQLYPPLLIVSDHSKGDCYTTGELQVPVYWAAIKQVNERLLKKLVHSGDNKVRNSENLYSAHYPMFVGHSDAVQKIKAKLPSIIKARDSVLIAGEPGTGKELLARLIVARSQNENMFIKIDCRELMPEILVNGWFSSTFGNGNGAKLATIFLDHIDQMSPASQAEMRLLIEASRKPLNGVDLKDRNTIRFVASSDKHIESRVREGAFRKDLFYRLNVIPVDLPPLRDRRDDISLLMDHFIIEACHQMKKCVKVPSQQAREMLYMHNWPGNVKELRNQMWRVAETGSEVCLYANTNMPKVEKNSSEYLLSVLGKEALPKPSEIKNYLSALKNMSLKGICDKFVTRTERRLMKKALESTHWNRRKAAQLLNISYKSMLNKIKAYDI
jgi:DNA-binding NtrC family response regulator